MERISVIDPAVILIILGFLMVGMGISLLPSEMLVGAGWRRFKLGLGVLLALSGTVLLVSNARPYLGPARAPAPSPTPLAVTPTPSYIPAPSLDLRLMKKSATSFDCSKVYLQFLDSNPTYNQRPDGRFGEEGKPLLEMVFRMQAINITDRDQLLTVCYTFGDKVLPPGWSVRESAISVKTGSAQLDLPSNRLWLPPKSQFQFFFPIVIYTEDQKTPHFQEALQFFGTSMDVEIGLRTDEGVFCSTNQKVRPLDVFH